MEAGLVAGRGRVLRTHVIASRPHCSLEELLADMLACLTPLRSSRVEGLAIGFPALGDYKTGILDASRSLYPCVQGFPLRDYLASKLGVPCRMTTDANMFALGVWAFGEGRGCRDVLALTIGTGLGVGVIRAGRLYGGRSGIPDEVLAAIADDTPHLGVAGSHYERLYGTDGITLAARAEAGDRAARRAFEQIGGALAVVIERLIAVLPRTQCVIVGGGVAASWRFFAPATRGALAERGIGLPLVRTRMRHPALAGGAALFVTRS